MVDSVMRTPSRSRVPSGPADGGAVARDDVAVAGVLGSLTKHDYHLLRSVPP